MDFAYEVQWRVAVIFFYMGPNKRNGLSNNGDAGDLRCHRVHYDIIVMLMVYHMYLFWYAFV